MQWLHEQIQKQAQAMYERCGTHILAEVAIVTSYAFVCGLTEDVIVRTSVGNVKIVLR